MTTKFSVWYDNQEQWDQETIDPPALCCATSSYRAAAERLADDSDASYGTFIVRDETTGEYRRIALTRGWQVASDLSTTLERLRSP